MLQAVGFSSEKEQLAYALAEQASMAAWNCLQIGAQHSVPAQGSLQAGDSAVAPQH